MFARVFLNDNTNGIRFGLEFLCFGAKNISLSISIKELILITSFCKCLFKLFEILRSKVPKFLRESSLVEGLDRGVYFLLMILGGQIYKVKNSCGLLLQVYFSLCSCLCYFEYICNQI